MPKERAAKHPQSTRSSDKATKNVTNSRGPSKREVSRHKMNDAISAIRSTGNDGNQIQRREPRIKPSKRHNAETDTNEEYSEHPSASNLPSKRRRVQSADSDAGDEQGDSRRPPAPITLEDEDHSSSGFSPDESGESSGESSSEGENESEPQPKKKTSTTASLARPKGQILPADARLQHQLGTPKSLLHSRIASVLSTPHRSGAPITASSTSVHSSRHVSPPSRRQSLPMPMSDIDIAVSESNDVHLPREIRKGFSRKTDDDNDSGKGSSSDEQKPPPKQKSTLTYFMSQDFRYASLVKKTISEMRICITLFQPMLVCDELDEAITSSIQSAAKEAKMEEVPSAIDGRVRMAIRKNCTTFRGHLVDALRAEIKSEFKIDVLKKPSSTVKRLKKYLPGEELDFRYREVRPDGTKVGKLARSIFTTFFVYFFNSLEKSVRKTILNTVDFLPVEGYAFACTIIEHLLQEFIDGGGNPVKRRFQPTTAEVQDSYTRHVKFVTKLEEKNPGWATRCLEQWHRNMRSKCLGTRGSDGDDYSDAQVTDKDMCINTDDEVSQGDED